MEGANRYINAELRQSIENRTGHITKEVMKILFNSHKEMGREEFVAIENSDELIDSITLDAVKAKEKIVNHDVGAIVEVAKDLDSIFGKVFHSQNTSSDVKQNTEAYLINFMQVEFVNTVRLIVLALLKVIEKNEGKYIMEKTHGENAIPKLFSSIMLKSLSSIIAPLLDLMAFTYIPKGYGGAIGTSFELSTNKDKKYAEAYSKLVMQKMSALCGIKVPDGFIANKTQVILPDISKKFWGLMEKVLQGLLACVKDILALARTNDIKIHKPSTEIASTAMGFKSNPIFAEGAVGLLIECIYKCKGLMETIDVGDVNARTMMVSAPTRLAITEIPERLITINKRILGTFNRINVMEIDPLQQKETAMMVYTNMPSSTRDQYTTTKDNRQMSIDGGYKYIKDNNLSYCDLEVCPMDEKKILTTCIDQYNVVNSKNISYDVFNSMWRKEFIDTAKY